MPIETAPYDAADYLTDDETIAGYLTEVLKEDDPRYIAKALGAVARARGGMTELSRKTGISREALYRALSATGNPELGTILRVMQALGIRLTASIEIEPRYELNELLDKSDPQAELAEADRILLNLTPASREL